MSKLAAVVAVGVVLGLAPSAQALVIDPTTGGSGSFFWGGGLGDSVEWPSDLTLEITVGAPSTIDFIVDDCCIVGDAFDLVVDGVLTAWTSDGFTGLGGLYHAEALGLFLSSGPHTLDLTVSADCCSAGGGSWAASAASPVPEPGTLVLVATGLCGLIYRRYRYHQG